MKTNFISISCFCLLISFMGYASVKNIPKFEVNDRNAQSFNQSINENGNLLPDSTVEFLSSNNNRTAKNVFTFNSQKQLLNEKEYLPDQNSENGYWSLGTNMDYSYDQTGNLALLISTYWNDGAVSSKTKMEATYEGIQKPIEIINYNFDLESQSWIPDMKTNYEYISSILHKETISIWDPESAKWEVQTYILIHLKDSGYIEYTETFFEETLFFKYVYEYNSDGKIQTMIGYSLNYGTGNLSENSKMEYKYNSQKLLSSNTIYNWMSNMWDPQLQNRYTYDTDNNILFSYVYGWSPSANNWIETNFTQYYYKNSGEVEQVALNPIIITSNNGVMEIKNIPELSTIGIYDLSGRELRNIAPHANTETISDIAAGCYIVRIGTKVFKVKVQ